MHYNEQILDTDILDDDIPSSILELDSAIDTEEQEVEEKSDKKIKAHIVRRNVEDYLAQKELERSLKEVFDDDFLLD